jgi:hypothetical protein
MKKLWMGLLLIVCSSGAWSQQVCIKDLVGKWETTDGAGLEIIDSSRMFITYGKERKPILSYQADFSKTPCWFDFVVQDTVKKLTTMKSLLLLDHDVLKWQVFDDDTRPADFAADRGDIVIMRRKR